MTAYAPVEWHDFFLGSAGASAALTGLLFVAISINLEQILKFPNLPSRAAGTLGILVATLVVSTFGLAPGQSTRVFGVEIAAAGLVIAVQAVWGSLGTSHVGDRPTWRIERLVTLLLPGLALVIGGISLLARSGGGLYWVLAAVVLAFVVTAINAWVLLVEVLR